MGSRILTTMLRQRLLYWAQGGPDQYGKPTWQMPAVGLVGRWLDKVVNFIGPDGTKQQSAAVAYVPQDMQVGDLLMLVTYALADTAFSTPLNAQGQPVNLGAYPLTVGAKEIKGWGKKPNFKATGFLRTAYLR